MKNLVDFYALLEVSYYATTNEIKEAYRKKVKETHPDKAGGDTDQFKLIKEAYDVLSNDEKRKRYDELLFKTSKFNVVVTAPMKAKVDEPPKKAMTSKIEKKKSKAWKITSIITLFISVLLIGLVFFLNNQIHTTNEEIYVLDNQLAALKRDNQDLGNENGILDTRLATVELENVELVGEVETLQKELLEKEVSTSTIQVSSAPPETIPEIETSSGYVTLGSTEEEVTKIQGTPNKIHFTRWYYDDNDWISFNYFDKTVDGWNNESGQMKVK